MEFEGKKAVVTPEAVFIIGTYDENGVPNAMNAAWGTQKDPDEVIIVLSKHKTTENFEKTGAFTLAFGTADTVTISDFFGVTTGNKVNKIEKAGVHVHKSAHVNAPIIEEYPLTLECRVLYQQEQAPDEIPPEIRQRYYARGTDAGDFHTAYIGQILSAYILRAD